MIVLATNQWLGRADVERPSARIGQLLAWMRTRPESFTVRSGARSVDAQAMLYSWGRTARNPDMDRTGDPGPNGLGVYATRTMDSLHLRDSAGVFRAIDVEASAAAQAQLAAQATALGLDTLSWDPGHYEDRNRTAEVVAGSSVLALVLLVIAAVVFTK